MTRDAVVAADVGVGTPGVVDLNGWMVDRGLALAYADYSKRYVAEEAAARAARRGVWATDGGCEKPWAWRAARRAERAAAAADKAAAAAPASGPVVAAVGGGGAAAPSPTARLPRPTAAGGRGSRRVHRLLLLRPGRAGMDHGWIGRLPAFVVVWSRAGGRAPSGGVLVRYPCPFAILVFIPVREFASCLLIALSCGSPHTAAW